MDLYVIRHAIAAEEATSNYEHDSERPLTDKGRKKMRQIAKGLRNMGVEPDLILSSPYVRARETAGILAEVLKVQKIVFSNNLVPVANPELLIAEINENYTVDSLALVGHEPYLSDLVGFLVAENAKIDFTLKKGGVCYLAADDLHHRDHCATLEWLLTPGILVEIADR